MNYNKEHFANCMFNPMVDGKMMQFSRLAEIVSPEWLKDENLDSILRYVVMVYDNKSPLWFTEKDWAKRKIAAADLAGFNLSDTEYMQTVYLNQNEICFGLSIQYLFKFIKVKEYSALVAFEFKYNENITELLTPIKGDTNAERLEAAKKKSVISVEIINDIKIIDGLWDDLYGDKELIKQAKAKRITPENIS